MKCKLISPQMVRNPLYNQEAQVQANREGRVYKHRKYIERPAGWEIDEPMAWRHVINGIAEPSDDECMEAVKSRFTDTQIWSARIAQRRVAKGIHPDDYEKFENGEIDGYAPDGSYILGPNGEPL